MNPGGQFIYLIVINGEQTTNIYFVTDLFKCQMKNLLLQKFELILWSIRLFLFFQLHLPVNASHLLLTILVPLLLFKKKNDLNNHYPTEFYCSLLACLGTAATSS